MSGIEDSYKLTCEIVCVCVRVCVHACVHVCVCEREREELSCSYKAILHIMWRVPEKQAQAFDCQTFWILKGHGQMFIHSCASIHVHLHNLLLLMHNGAPLNTQVSCLKVKWSKIRMKFCVRHSDLDTCILNVLFLVHVFVFSLLGRSLYYVLSQFCHEVVPLYDVLVRCA